MEATPITLAPQRCHRPTLSAKVLLPVQPYMLEAIRRSEYHCKCGMPGDGRASGSRRGDGSVRSSSPVGSDPQRGPDSMCSHLQDQPATAITLPDLLGKLFAYHRSRNTARNSQIDRIAAWLAAKWTEGLSAAAMALLRGVWKDEIPLSRLRDKDDAAREALKAMRAYRSEAEVLMNAKEDQSAGGTGFFIKSPFWDCVVAMVREKAPISGKQLAEYASAVNLGLRKKRKMVARIARLEAAGFTDELVGFVQREYPEAADAIGLPNTVIPPSTEPSHSSDFTTVNWFGERFVFAKGNQAQAVRVLWEAWEQGGHALSQETIGERIKSSAARFELRKAFRRRANGKTDQHPAWGTMIQPNGKGCYKLAGAKSANNPQ